MDMKALKAAARAAEKLAVTTAAAVIIISPFVPGVSSITSRAIESRSEELRTCASVLQGYDPKKSTGELVGTCRGFLMELERPTFNPYKVAMPQSRLKLKA